jgi:hypothetical protein
MDALALLVAEEEPGEARELSQRAAAGHRQRRVLFPEASYGAAIKHHLELETDAERAVTLAEQNHRIAQNGESQTLLARAYLQAGRLVDAFAAIEPVLDSRWRSATTHAVAARIFDRSGMDARARDQRVAALVLNPHALDGLDE